MCGPVLHLLDRLDDTPALVCDATYDVLAWNAMAATLIVDFSALPPGERNVIWRFFTDPNARDRHDADGARRFARESVAAGSTSTAKRCTTRTETSGSCSTRRRPEPRRTKHSACSRSSGRKTSPPGAEDAPSAAAFRFRGGASDPSV
jgi:hypothetical protein